MQQWLINHSDQIVAASNFTSAIVMFFLAGAVAFSIKNLNLTNRTDLYYMLIGIATVLVGWGVDKLYWGMRRVFRMIENSQVDELLDVHAYISLIPGTVIIIGLVMTIGPLLSFITNSTNKLKNMVLAAAIIFSLTWFAFWQLNDVQNTVIVKKQIEHLFTKPETNVIEY